MPSCHSGKGTHEVVASWSDLQPSGCYLHLFSVPSGSDLQGEIFASLLFGDHGSSVPREASLSPPVGVVPQTASLQGLST